MKFKCLVEFYKLNDDGTITVKVDEKYYRAKMQMPIYMSLYQLVKDEELKQGVSFECEFGLGYVRNVGLVLQLLAI